VERAEGLARRIEGEVRKAEAATVREVLTVAEEGE
jgi:hypothetical protein